MARFIRPVIELIPAYGRTYSDNESVIASWKDGRDFQDSLSGQYCSIRDLEYIQTEMGTECVYVRSGYNLVIVWEAAT